MPRNFDAASRLRRLDPAVAARAGLGVLVVLNLLGVWMVFHPPGGSVASLSNDMLATQQEIGRKRAVVRNLHAVVEKVEKARGATEKFESQYYLTRRTYASTLVDELGRAAKGAGIREREKSFNVEPIDGADNLQLLTISANYEGNYADLVQFVSQMDRSDRLLILESLQAQPQAAGQGLSIQVKVNAILREDGSVATAETAKRAEAASSATGEAPAPTAAAPQKQPPAPPVVQPAVQPEPAKPMTVAPPSQSRSGPDEAASPRPTPFRGPRRRPTGEVEK